MNNIRIRQYLSKHRVDNQLQAILKTKVIPDNVLDQIKSEVSTILPTIAITTIKTIFCLFLIRYYKLQ